MSERTPLASIVVPTHARPARLRRLVDSLAALTPGSMPYEIIIVDDGSPEKTAPDAAALAGRTNGSPDCVGLSVRRQPQAGPAAARNHGARLARGERVLFIDDDCTVEPDWLEAMLTSLDRHPDALIASRLINGLPDSLCATVSMSLLDEVEAAGHDSSCGLAFVASAAIACRREAFLAIGGFDTAYPRAAGEDRAFCRAWRLDGRKIRRAERALVHHFHPLDLVGFWRQQSNYGRGAERYRRTRPSGGEPAMPPGFHQRLLTHPLRRTDWPLHRRWLALPLVALSQVAVASGLARETLLRGASSSKTQG